MYRVWRASVERFIEALRIFSIAFIALIEKYCIGMSAFWMTIYSTKFEKHDAS
jgi:hypothetical protein